MRIRCLLVTLLSALCAGAFSHVGAQPSVKDCGSLENAFGPYDYRPDKHVPVKYDNRSHKNILDLVEGAHFRPEVEALVRGTTNGGPGGDIDYTLRAFPNNHRALLAMMRLGEKEKTEKPSGSRYTVECWFDRAMRFRPDDHIVRMIFTTFLTKNNRKPEAMQQLEFILKSAKDNAFTHQNVGLLYFDLGEHPLALAQAHKAIELGLNRPDLRDKLQAIGKWAEPAPTEAASEPVKP